MLLASAPWRSRADGGCVSSSKQALAVRRGGDRGRGGLRGQPLLTPRPKSCEGSSELRDLSVLLGGAPEDTSGVAVVLDCEPHARPPSSEDSRGSGRGRGAGFLFSFPPGMGERLSLFVRGALQHGKELYLESQRGRARPRRGGWRRGRHSSRSTRPHTRRRTARWSSNRKGGPTASALPWGASDHHRSQGLLPHAAVHRAHGGAARPRGRPLAGLFRRWAVRGDPQPGGAFRPHGACGAAGRAVGPADLGGARPLRGNRGAGGVPERRLPVRRIVLGFPADVLLEEVLEANLTGALGGPDMGARFPED